MSMHIGVCSWSLRPGSPAALVESMNRLGIEVCQLALVPCIDDTAAWASAPRQLREAGKRVVSGMLAMEGEDYTTLESIRTTGGVALDERWQANLERARRVAAFAAAEKIPLVTFHAGFLPHEPKDPRRALMLGRLREVAGVFAGAGVRLGLETGQETAHTLTGVLEELGESNVGVNFDPANMILYGMGDPVEAMGVLSRSIVQIHVKDAQPSAEPGTWGTEVRVGSGAVDWPAFFDVALALPAPVDFIIEREAGEDRHADIEAARHLILAELTAA